QHNVPVLHPAMRSKRVPRDSDDNIGCYAVCRQISRHCERVQQTAGAHRDIETATVEEAGSIKCLRLAGGSCPVPLAHLPIEHQLVEDYLEALPCQLAAHAPDNGENPKDCHDSHGTGTRIQLQGAA